ncbi:MAG: leucine-rich repeat domain-containing protein, partial [Verrucomicrobiaceae bacterium]
MIDSFSPVIRTAFNPNNLPMILPQVTRPLLATVFFACITTFSSQAGSLGPLIYSDNGTSITIIDCVTNTRGAVVVPSHIDGKPVTTIGASAFYYCSKITSVTLPESVTTLGEFSFYNCKALANINLPEGISVLESGTFSRCAELKSITIPSTITMTYGAFYNSGLEQATIAGGSETIAGGLFWG